VADKPKVPVLIRPHEQFELRAWRLGVAVQDDARRAGAGVGDVLHILDLGHEHGGVQRDAAVGHARLGADLVVVHELVFPVRMARERHQVRAEHRPDVQGIIDAAQAEAARVLRRELDVLVDVVGQDHARREAVGVRRTGLVGVALVGKEPANVSSRSSLKS
jgi:hypothetical protein